MVTFMRTLKAFNRMMTDTRRAMEDVRYLLSDDLEKLQYPKNPLVVIGTMELLANDTESLETRLTWGAKDVPAEALEDNDFWILFAAFQSSGEKLKNMGTPFMILVHYYHYLEVITAPDIRPIRQAKLETA
ncbi:unnamed protein product [Bemisia tabaci]|uniref:Uncharacterized protein n=1 Tax=Bemisia tabaci TaxID=7038 RepID=A0A9P0EZ35_BEMTA|nr:unnamed protein product [Bemisia tabaci]